MIIALIAAALAGGGAYLVLQRGMVRIIIGMTFISHAANLIILSAGVGAWRQEPLMARAEPGTAADALPQAFVLTAIVITMAVTAFMLAMAALGRDDDTRVKEDREANAQLSTAGRAVRRSDPSDVGAGAGAARHESFPEHNPHGGDDL
ncbi:MAG TPA: cation:proton antiporter subunit C [Actinomycetales bacterium]|uniref:cation:proton antiporter subunit C n=1 Tax=uncultured Corynebacterium sp. TaxID=159447 RepID=UPI001756F767|nr:cation:proton antiporter subunit C [uncultured Corynebacterium sp.]HHU45628.1 cation:proton antiporter subunit C [Actinomycetales bacterium]